MKINLISKDKKINSKSFSLSAILLYSVFVLLFLSILFTPAQSQASTKTWDSGGANNNCSTAGNWDNDTIPTTTDDIVINSTADAIIWDSACPQTVNSFLMDTGFTGSVQVNTVYGSSGFTVFTITTNLTINAGTMKHADNSTAETYRLNLAVGGDFTIGASGTMNVDGLGYDINSGPGAGGITSNYYGGSHGGFGAFSFAHVSGISYGTTYGSLTAPVNLGSGGSYGSGHGRSGGGAIQFSVDGTTIVNGIISADGIGWHSSGSGGSIYFQTDILAGSGIIRANGGGDPTTASGGGGGRVAIILNQIASTFESYTGIITAYGGNCSNDGAAGTVYKQTQAEVATGGTLIIDNFNQITTNNITTKIPSGSTWTVNSTIIQNKGNFELTYDSNLLVPILTVGNNGIVTVNQGPSGEAVSHTGDILIQSGGTLTHSDNSIAETYKLRMNVTGDLIIDSGGFINVNGLGYDAHYGPGTPIGGQYVEGASYGGRGYSAYVSPPTYGSLTAPVNLGSGGGFLGQGYSGGGAIILNVSGLTTINGTISADGYNVGPGNTYGMGSGGSVYITTSTINGVGIISANGGQSPDYKDAGGGGRISIILTGINSDFLNFSGATFKAYGGYMIGANAAAGTIYKQTQAQGGGKGDLIIDNNNYSTISGVVTSISSSVTDATVGSVTLTGSKAGKLTIDSGQTLTVHGAGTTLTIGTGTTFTNNGTLNLGGTTPISNSGTITHGSGSTINYIGQADNSTVTIPNLSYQNIGINKTGTTFTTNSAIGLAGNLNITAGTFNPNNFIPIPIPNHFPFRFNRELLCLVFRFSTQIVNPRFQSSHPRIKMHRC